MQTYFPATAFHPGEYLKEEMTERNLTQTALANILGKPIKTINEIINKKKSITPEMAFLFESVFQVSAETWLGLQKTYDLFIIKPEIQKKYLNTKKRAENYFNETVSV